MTKRCGFIKLVPDSAGGCRLVLWRWSIDGETQETVWDIYPIPAWLKDYVAGNAGQRCVVILDAEGNPTGATVG